MIHVSSSSFNGNEKKYVLDCLNRDWISQGRYVREFEEKFADLCGVKYAITCSSGTAALHLIFLGLGVDSRDVVIVPALTYIATANAARYCGARIKFCDINESDWCLDPEYPIKIEEENVNRVICVPVHLYDAVCRTNELDQSKIIAIEDAAQAVGASKVGSLGLAAAFSLYGSKVVACGEGGLITTNDSELAESIKLYRGQGATTAGSYYHSVVGYNYRMTDLQAAVGLAQLERLPEMIAYRREIINRYRDNLSGFHKVTLQEGTRSSCWIMAVLVPEDVNREFVRDRLLSSGIETRPFFDPIPSLPPYRSLIPPVAANVASRGICLPTHTEMTVGDVDYICEKLAEVLEVAS